MKFALYIALIALFVQGCSTGKEVKKIDTTIDAKGQNQEGVIGLKDGVAVIQKNVSAEDELRQQQWKNYEEERTLANEHYWLKRCREELSDPRLGGNGVVTELPEIDNMKKPDDVKEAFGLDESGQLKFVKEQDFRDKIQNERAYGDNLKSMTKTVKKYKETCEREMRTARVKAGLPMNRFEGKFKYDSKGRIIQTVHENENSLDDAFRINAQSKEVKE